MSDSNNTPQSINPSHMYPLSAICRILDDVSLEWAKENLIRSKQCAYKRQGRLYLIKGEWLIKWCEREHFMPDEDG